MANFSVQHALEGGSVEIYPIVLDDNIQCSSIRKVRRGGHKWGLEKGEKAGLELSLRLVMPFIPRSIWFWIISAEKLL